MTNSDGVGASDVFLTCLCPINQHRYLYSEADVWPYNTAVTLLAVTCLCKGNGDAFRETASPTELWCLCHPFTSRHTPTPQDKGP